MSSDNYFGRRMSQKRSSKTRSPISSSSSSPDAYKEYEPHQHGRYNDACSNYESYETKSTPMFRRRVAPSPPSSRKLTPSPPTYSRRVAPSPPPPFSDYPNSSVRLKASSAGEWSPPPVKRRIAPPPPESFTNQDMHFGPNGNDYNRSYYEPPDKSGYDNDRCNLGSPDRLHHNLPGGMPKRARVEYSQRDLHNYRGPINGSSSNTFHSDTLNPNHEHQFYGRSEMDSTNYTNCRYNRYKSSSPQMDYREPYREPKVRKPPPAPHIPASSKSISESQSITKTESRLAPPLHDSSIINSSQSQNEEGECVSNDDDEEEGELISNEERLKRDSSVQRRQDTFRSQLTFDPNSTASLDEQEQEVGNPISFRHGNNIPPSTTQGDNGIESSVSKKPPLPIHIQKSPLKGSFISSSILTRDENNVYTEVKKDEICLDEPTNCSSTDEKELDEDIENISVENEDEEDLVELENTEENKNEPDKGSLTLEYVKQSPRLMIDSKFLAHLAEMHPVSALNELSHRLNWSTPNFSIAFECGPPMAKMYIFKVLINGQTFQPTIAVDNKKDAKQNVAWYALQEMGFVKSDPANPL